jgi:NADH:ubiquinone oxidoreductase subunit E
MRIESMNRIVEILIKRYNITRKKAIAILNEIIEMIEENPGDAEYLVAEELGLSLDYMVDILDEINN